MQAKDIVLVFDYYYWATNKILTAASHASEEQFVTPSAYDGNSLRDILTHTLSAERRWRSRWQGYERPPRLSATEFPTVATLDERWQSEEQQMREWLATLNDDDVQGDFQGFPLWQTMLHVANHGTQHRSEAAMLLTGYGHSPGDIDLVFYLEDR